MRNIKRATLVVSFPKRGDWTLRLIEIEDHKMQGGDLSFKNA